MLRFPLTLRLAPLVAVAMAFFALYPPLLEAELACLGADLWTAILTAYNLARVLHAHPLWPQWWLRWRR